MQTIAHYKPDAISQEDGKTYNWYLEVYHNNTLYFQGWFESFEKVTAITDEWFKIFYGK